MRLNIRDLCRFIQKNDNAYKHRIVQIETTAKFALEAHDTITVTHLRDWIRNYIVYHFEDCYAQSRRDGRSYTLSDEDVDTMVAAILPYFLDKYKDNLR
jgi:hypothetical protein